VSDALPAPPDAQPIEISVVVPVYFNEQSLPSLHARITRALEGASALGHEVIYVDDGSGDGSLQALRKLCADDPRARALRLSRNFGSQAAIQAGLSRARGRCVAVLAADLQDPPEMLAELLQRWRSGAEVVLATRASREDPLLSRLFSWVFYRLFRLLVSTEMPPGGFDFFLLDRRVVAQLVQAAEKNTHLGASILWLGFRREVLPYHRAGREHGASRWGFWRRVKYLYDSLLGFSYVPLRVMTALGVLGVVVAFGYGLVSAVWRLRHPEEVPGWASLMVVTLFFDGLVLASLGTVGEYVWRSFDAARGRPGFVVAEETGALGSIPRAANAEREDR